MNVVKTPLFPRPQGKRLAPDNIGADTAVERTLSIIKPDAVGKNVVGQIISRFEEAGLTVVAAKMLHLSDAVAGGFYAEHNERPFYPDLVAFMTSGLSWYRCLKEKARLLAIEN